MKLKVKGERVKAKVRGKVEEKGERKGAGEI